MQELHLIFSLIQMGARIIESFCDFSFKTIPNNWMEIMEWNQIHRLDYGGHLI